MTSKTRKASPAKLPRRPVAAKPVLPSANPTMPGKAPARPKYQPASPCIVGIGASAGGLDALRAFFRVMPRDSGIAFIVIQHLDPTHKSLAAEVIGKWTAMPVAEAREGVQVKPNHIYTIPPDKYLSLEAGKLRLNEPTVRRGLRLPVDYFFNSLAEDQQEKAIAMVFSGTGSDGALGVRSIVAHGGIALAQDPKSAQFDGMPSSAIATGMMNYVLSLEKMPEILVAYAHHPYVEGTDDQAGVPVNRENLNEILGIIRIRNQCNFSGYKQNTLIRRIQRRMGLSHIDNSRDYLALLRRDSKEVDALFRDMRIGVTDFFRDGEAWKLLQKSVIAPLVAGKGKEDPIRAWVPGVSTGEEAYSLAMLMLEEARKTGKPCQVQIFATDINEDSLNIARSGIYPEGIATRISPERLKHFFTLSSDNHHYQVSTELRESVVFGAQNLFTDPPFSRLDLISCRNLLIYLEPEAQQRVIGLFDFSLRAGGYLFLGSAETLGVHESAFKPISKKWRIFEHIGGNAHRHIELPLNTELHRSAAVKGASPQTQSKAAQLANLALQLLLDRFVPASVVVNGKYEALYYCGPTENYLKQPRGAPTTDLLAQASNGLRSRLRNALREAETSHAAVVIQDVRVKRADAYVGIRLSVLPLPAHAELGHLLLVVFEDSPRPALLPSREPAEGAVIRELEDELRETRSELKGTIERLESSNEELKVSNEEVVSTNEELQSINEELESSKEELQSLNEELSSVNQQLVVKISELELANNDIHNLLSSSEIATICLDREFRIKWFAPGISNVFNLIVSDIGRPIADFTPALTGAYLIEEATAVLQKLAAVQHEFLSENGSWFLRRILPYRACDDRIDGVIVTFSDITEIKKKSEDAIRARKAFADSLEEKVQERTAQLRAMAVDLTMTEDYERRNYAQDLHDDLGQVLAIIKLKLSSLEMVSAHQPVTAIRPQLHEISKMVDQANRSVRSLLLQISPPVLHQLGLIPALEGLVEEMEKNFGIKINCHDDGKDKPLDQAGTIIVYRSVRELLINIVKHAQVNMAELSCVRVDNQLDITISDAGPGFLVPKTLQPNEEKGFGLFSIQERISFIGGSLHIDSRLGAGTTVTLSVPLSVKLPGAPAGGAEQP